MLGRVLFYKGRYPLFIMAIPDYQNIMLPLLKLASDKKEHSMQDTIERLAALYRQL